ncbi:MAG: energy-coupled thiamine transporter ThiT [Oscillospiraceae bacterium]|nr:energy-coupled thiamine transporter ThiT [Oscillospiraceae bacterium]
MNTKKLVTSAIMLALASVLSTIKIFQMPLGGSITLLSMLPVVLLSIKYGTKWGFFSAFAYSLIQFALDFPSLMGYGYTAFIWAGSIVFDYLIAFTILGIAGIWRDKGFKGIMGGIALALCSRFLSHVISGSIFFAIWCPDGWSPIPYAICYNGAFMLPELIFTLAGAAILFKLPQTNRLLNEQ